METLKSLDGPVNTFPGLILDACPPPDNTDLPISLFRRLDLETAYHALASFLTDENLQIQLADAFTLEFEVEPEITIIPPVTKKTLSKEHQVINRVTASEGLSDKDLATKHQKKGDMHLTRQSRSTVTTIASFDDPDNVASVLNGGKIVLFEGKNHEMNPRKYELSVMIVQEKPDDIFSFIYKFSRSNIDFYTNSQMHLMDAIMGIPLKNIDPTQDDHRWINIVTRT